MHAILSKVIGTPPLFATTTEVKAPSYNADALESVEKFRAAFIAHLVGQGIIDSQTHRPTSLAKEPLPPLYVTVQTDLKQRLLQADIVLESSDHILKTTFTLEDLLRKIKQQGGDNIDDILLIGSIVPNYLGECFFDWASTLALTPNTPLYNQTLAALKEDYVDIDLCVVLRPGTTLTASKIHERICKELDSVKEHIKYDPCGFISFTPEKGKRIKIHVRQSQQRPFLSVHDALQLSLLPLLSEEKGQKSIRPIIADPKNNPEGGWLSIIHKIAKTISIPNIATVDPYTTLATVLSEMVKGYQLQDPNTDKQLLEAFLSAVHGQTDPKKVPHWVMEKLNERAHDPHTPSWVLVLIEALHRACDSHLKDHLKAILLIALEAVNTLEKLEDTSLYIPYFWKEICLIERGIISKDRRTEELESTRRVRNGYLRETLYHLEQIMQAYPMLTTKQQWIVAKAKEPHLCSNSLKIWRELPLQEISVPGSPFDLALFDALRKSRPDLAIKMLTALVQNDLSISIAIEMAMKMVEGARVRAETSPEFSNYLWSKAWLPLLKELESTLEALGEDESPPGTHEFIDEVTSYLKEKGHFTNVQDIETPLQPAEKAWEGAESQDTFEIDSKPPVATPTQETSDTQSTHSSQPSDPVVQQSAETAPRAHQFNLIKTYLKNGQEDEAEKLWIAEHKREAFTSPHPPGYSEVALHFAETRQTTPEHIQRLLTLNVTRILRSNAYIVIRDYLKKNQSYDDDNIKMRIDFFRGHYGLVALKSEFDSTCKRIREETKRIGLHYHLVDTVIEVLRDLNAGNHTKVSELYFVYFYIKILANNTAHKPFTKENILQVAKALDGKTFEKEAAELRKIYNNFKD